MRRSLRDGLIVCQAVMLAATLFALPHAASAGPRKPAAPPPPAVSDTERAALAGPWHGSWTSDNYRYDATMQLTVDGSGNVEGWIDWTLRVSPGAEGRRKIGNKALEYVHGKYYPEPGALVLEGYRKDDPNAVWDLDKYRLTLSPDRAAMGGITQGSGSWAGHFFLTR
jgi:hypothetical protein